jgi:hypothetical protein
MTYCRLSLAELVQELLENKLSHRLHQGHRSAEASRYILEYSRVAANR